jgi:hypothetical protein
MTVASGEGVCPAVYEQGRPIAADGRKLPFSAVHALRNSECNQRT